MSVCTLIARKSGRASRAAGARGRGAVLATGLIVLAVMAFIALGSMRGMVLNERMTGNLFDQNAAFEASEAGLQAALHYLETRSQAPIPSSSGTNQVWPGCRVTDGPVPIATASADGTISDGCVGSSHPCCQLRSIVGSFRASPPTGGVALDAADLGGSGLGNALEDYQPRVFVEDRFVPSQDLVEQSRGVGIHYYTATAVGIGRNSQTRAILQSTIPKVFAW